MRNITMNQAQKEPLINENFLAVNNAQGFGYRTQGTSGLYFGYWQAVVNGRSGSILIVPEGRILLTASATNLVYFNTQTNIVEAIVSDNFTNSIRGHIPIAKITTDATTITNYEDYRVFNLGTVGQMTDGSQQKIPVVEFSSNFTIARNHAGCLLIHAETDTATRTITIPANSTTAFEIGTVLTIHNASIGNIVLNIAGTDELKVAGSGTLGARNITQNGLATITKTKTTGWLISGLGVI